MKRGELVSTVPQFKVKVVPYDSGSALWEQCKDIRITVFHHEQGYPLEDEIDEYDPQCIHLLITTADEKEQPAGTLRYFPPPKSKIGRVAVYRDFRGKGLGGMLIKGLEALVMGRLEDTAGCLNGARADELILHAQGEFP